MRTRLVATLSVLCCSALLAGAAAAAEEFKPMPAAEAETWMAEQRDYLTDILWVGIDGYWHEGDWDSSLALCKKIIEIDPHFVEAYTNAAYLLWNRNQDDEATAMYKAGIGANPDSPDLYFDYGFFQRDRKHLDAAIKLFRLANERGANLQQQHMLPNTLEEAGQKQAALAEWRKLLEQHPDDHIAKNKIARLEKELAPPAARP